MEKKDQTFARKHLKADLIARQRVPPPRRKPMYIPYVLGVILIILLILYLIGTL